MTESPHTLTVLVPALNEKATLESVLRDIEFAAVRVFHDFEIIIVDDGSTDGTGALADRLAAASNRIQVVHHSKSRNLGGALKSGLALARMRYVCAVHANGGTRREALVSIWSHRGEADLVIPYILNAHQRPRAARIASSGFTSLLNLVFGLNLRYYLHHVLYRRELLQSVTIRTRSYAYQPEAVIKLLKSGCTCVEVGVEDNFDKHGPTRSYSVRNLTGVAVFLATCLFDIYLGPRTAEVRR